MLAMKIRLIQSGDYSALFRAFMIPSGFSSPAKLWHITSHYFLLNLPIQPIQGTIRHIRCSPEVEFARYTGRRGEKRQSIRCRFLSYLFTPFVLPLNIHSSVNEQEADSPLSLWVQKVIAFFIQLQTLITLDRIFGCLFTCFQQLSVIIPLKYYLVPVQIFDGDVINKCPHIF